MVVDTSVWIDYFNGHASPQADYLTHAIADAESIVIPGLVLTEVLLGFNAELDANKVADLLSIFDQANETSRADYRCRQDLSVVPFKRLHDPLNYRLSDCATLLA